MEISITKAPNHNFSLGGGEGWRTETVSTYNLCFFLKNYVIEFLSYVQL